MDLKSALVVCNLPIKNFKCILKNWHFKKFFVEVYTLWYNCALGLEYIAIALLYSCCKHVVQCYPRYFMPLHKIHTSSSLYDFAFLISCIFCRVDHDSTKQEFCSCNMKLRPGLGSCDVFIIKSVYFHLQNKIRWKMSI